MCCWSDFLRLIKQNGSIVFQMMDTSQKILQIYPVTYDQLKQTTFSTCGQHDGRVPPAEFGRVTCSPNPARGRYVYISLPDANLLVLCEVRVFGGKFGMATLLTSAIYLQMFYKSNALGLNGDIYLSRCTGYFHIDFQWGSWKYQG